jgi:isopentenyldiphosphate isomerase
MPKELFDVLDCAGRKTGKTIARPEAHRTGTWHGAFHCLMLYAREGTGYALFQQRSSEKLIAPGVFDVSVGGHYAAGEGAETAGPREIREELGLDVGFRDLLPVGRRVFVYCFAPGILEYEFQDVFLLARSINPAALSLQTDEVSAVLELGVERGIELFSGKIPAAEGSLFTSTGAGGKITITAAEFVPCLDNYYLKMLLLARRYFAGERQLLII